MRRKNSPSKGLRHQLALMLERLMRRSSPPRQCDLGGPRASRIEPLEQRLFLTSVPAGQIFLSEDGSSAIGQFTTAGAVVQAKLASGLSFPTGIAAVGSELFVTSLSDTVSEYTTAGISEGVVVHGLNEPESITASGSFLFVSNFGNGTVGEYNATTGIAIKTTLVTGLNGPTGVAVYGNDLFVENNTAGTIGEYNATTGATIKASLISKLAAPHAIVALDGFLFITTGNPDAIAEYTTTGAVVHAALGSGVQGATGIAVELNPILTASVHTLTLPATTQGAPGVTSNFTLSGIGLTADTPITLTAPAGAELSLTDNIAGFAPSLILNPDVTGSLATTTIYIDIAPSATANINGNLTINDPADSVSQNITIKGTSTATTNPPTITSLAGNGPVISGTSLTLTADGVTALSPATVKTVDFYFDTQGTGIFNLAKDKLLGVGTLITGTNNYTRTIATTSLPVGDEVFFARAIDSKAHDSLPISTTVTITPAPQVPANLKPRRTLTPSWRHGKRIV